MKKKKLIIGAIVIAVLIVLAGVIFFLTRPPKDIEVPQVEVVDLTDHDPIFIANWNGKWNSIVYFAQDEEIGPSVQSGLKKLEGGKWQAKLESNLVAYRMKNNSLTAYSELQDDTGTPLGTVLFDIPYTFNDAIVDPEGNTWYRFEARIETEYQYLILTEVMADEETSISYFRMRYGSEGFEDLLLKSDWNPIMVSDQAPKEKLAAFLENLRQG